MFILIATVLLLAIPQGECLMNATSVLHADNSIIFVGTLIFTQDDANAPVRITGSLRGITSDSVHGFHIHVNPVDEGEPNCTAAGPHFNPYNTPHGPPSAAITARHVGDLGNLTTDVEGNINLDMQDSIIQLYNSTQSIVNRSVVIHRYRDDGGEGGFPDSNTTGNAGPRILCGLIKLVSQDTTTTPPLTTTTPSLTTTTPPLTTTITLPPNTTYENTTSHDHTTPPYSVGLNIQPMKLLLFAIFVLLFVQNGQSDMIATANIHVDSTQYGIGTVLFHQRDADSPVQVFGIIDSLKPDTVHGFHVHRDPLEKDVVNCSAAGPHFNPYEKLHGSREANLDHRHVGDLGNVTANENGIIIIEFRDQIIDLYNATRSIAKRTIVLHAIRDDGGRGGFPDSNTTGNAGARIACGTISLASEYSSEKSHSSTSDITISNFFRKLFP